MVSFIVLLLLLGLTVLVVVRKGTTLTPRQAVANYLEARRRGRTEEAYGYLTAGSRARVTPGDYHAANSLGSGLVAEVLGRRVSFVVQEVEEHGDQAEAAVFMTAPDFRLILAELFTVLDPEALPEETLAALTFLCRRTSDLLDRYRQDSLPMRTTGEIFTLRREKGKWKIAAPPEGKSPAAGKDAGMT